MARLMYELEMFPKDNPNQTIEERQTIHAKRQAIKVKYDDVKKEYAKLIKEEREGERNNAKH